MISRRPPLPIIVVVGLYAAAAIVPLLSYPEIGWLDVAVSALLVVLAAGLLFLRRWARVAEIWFSGAQVIAVAGIGAVAYLNSNAPPVPLVAGLGAIAAFNVVVIHYLMRAKVRALFY